MDGNGGLGGVSTADFGIQGGIGSSCGNVCLASYVTVNAYGGAGGSGGDSTKDGSGAGGGYPAAGIGGGGAGRTVALLKLLLVVVIQVVLLFLLNQKKLLVEKMAYLVVTLKILAKMNIFIQVEAI